MAKRVKEMHCYVCPDMAKGAPTLSFRRALVGDLIRMLSACPSGAEFLKYDENPEKYIRNYQGTKVRTRAPRSRVREAAAPRSQLTKYLRAGQGTTGQKWSCDVGYERFLGPEIFFNPEILRYLRWWCVARGAARS